MYSSYLTIAWRNLFKNKVFSLLNIMGLGLGMAVCMLILLYVSHELSFDRFHQKSDRIFSTLMKLKMGENDLRMNLFTPDFGEKVKAANPEVSEVLRFAGGFRQAATLKSEEGRQFIEDRFFFADPSIFRVFSFQMKEGDPKSALDAPDAVVISEPMARKYFGEADPLGKVLTYNKKDLLRVTGVFAEMPANSSLHFDFIAPVAAYQSIFKREYPGKSFDTAPNWQTWFLLDEPASKDKVEAVIPSALPKSDDPVFANAQYTLSPLTEMHLGNNWGDFSNSKYISIFLVVAALVLFLALFNYMSLTTARASSRAREVGVRKVLGAHGKHLRGQFYGESVLISGLGFMAGLGIFASVRPSFYALLDLKIDDQFLHSPLFISVLGGLFLFSALLAGIYPALLMSRFSPVQVMKGNTAEGSAGAGVRRGLMVFQFTVSTALIVFSIGIREQLRYMQTRDIGLNKAQVMVVPLTKGIGAHFTAFKQDIRAQTGVQRVSAASFAFFQGGWDMWFIKTPTTQEDIGINAMMVDEHFFETLEIAWKIPPADPHALASKQQLLLNESGVEQLKIAENPVGQHLDLGQGQQEIVGVTKDFNFIGLQRKIEGMLFAVVPDTASLVKQGGHLYIRLEPGMDLLEKTGSIGQIFKQYEADAPFDYYFLDDAFDQQFRSEKRLAYLFSGFTSVAVLLACLGLLGLIIYTSERRTKEIGIRKVLGASVAGIAALLVKDFLKLVLIAVVIASPLAYYFLQKWLSDFAYRIEMQGWMFAAAGLAAVAIALLTVGIQSLRAAWANPVKSLRSE